MKPKVLIYSDCPIFGGAENLVVNILQHSDLPDEFGMHFVYRDNPPYREGLVRKVTRPVPMTPVWLPERLEWIEAMEERRLWKPLRWFFKAIFRLVEPGLFCWGVARLWVVFSRVGPDVVQINDGGYPGSLGCRAAAVAARLAGVRRVIFNVNSAAKPVALPQAALEPLIDRLVIRSSDVFVTASQFAGKALAVRGFPAGRIFQIPNSSPVPAPSRDPAGIRAELGLRDRDVAFAVIAYFGPWKGHNVLVEAVALMKRRRPQALKDLRILLIGEGPDVGRIRRLVEHAGLADVFRFLGFRADAMELLNAADGLILPSIFWKGVSEDMPYCVLEAMALSKPVVASRLSGIAETVVHDETGLLIEPGDASALADAVFEMLSGRELRDRMGEAGRRRFFELYETRQTTRAYRDLYLGILPGPPVGKPRVLIYADCPVFGGADVLTVQILQDERCRREFDLAYVYRYNRRFHLGMRNRLKASVPVRRVYLLERQELLDVMENRVTFAPLRYGFKAVFRLIDYVLFPLEVLSLWRVFRTFSPSLVHVNNGGYPGALGCRAAAVAARLAGAERVVFGVNNLARPLRLPWELAEAAIDRLVLRCTAVFTTASLAARDALALRGFPKRLIEPYPNGVREPESVRLPGKVRADLGLAPDAIALAMVAYFEPRKGHRVLVEAARMLVESRPALARNLKFVLVADGPELPAVRRSVAERGLEGHFLFLGYRSDALDIINACDGLLLPSVAAEDMPISVLEAMALGKPVVASEIAGVAEEVKDGETGLLVPPGDAARLSAAIERLVRDAALRRAMGAAGRERFLELFEIDRAVARYLGLYLKLLGRAHPPEAALPERTARSS